MSTVQWAAGGDREALQEFCSRYYPRLRRLSAQLGRPQDADDAVQEVFLRALRHLPQFRVGADVWPWLSTITKHVVIDQQRRTRRETVCDDDMIALHISGHSVVERRRALVTLAQT